MKTLPAVRFKDAHGSDFPDWATAALGEIADIKLGKMLDKEKQTTGHLLPYLNNISLRWNEVDTSNLPRMYFRDNELDRFGLRAGDVVVCEGGEPGRSALWDGRLPDLKFQKAIHRVRFNVPFEQRLLVLYLEKIAGTTKFEMLFTGGGIKHLTRETFSLLQIPMISLPEQRKIADFLTAVDGRIGQLSQKKALLEDYKKGVMQQLFTQALRFKDDHGNDFPDWEKKKLGEVGAFKNGINKDKSEFGFGTPFVNLMDVFGKRVLNQANFGLINSTEKERSSYDLRAGDVLFIRSSVKRTGVGEAVIIEENIEAAVYSGFLIRFRQKGQHLTSGFMTYCFSSPAFRKELLSYATTSANTNINQESLAEVAVAIPSLPEQTKIANFLTALDRKIESVSQQITHTQAFKKGLLQQMFV
jgi:type I restriction enzyme S subunit